MTTYTTADVNKALAGNDPLVFTDTATGIIYSMATDLDGVNEPVARFCMPWKEISARRYNDQLEVLPPLDWHRSGACESFKSMEMYAGNVTSIFAACEGRFFECRDYVTLTPAQIAQDIRALFFARELMNSGH